MIELDIIGGSVILGSVLRFGIGGYNELISLMFFLMGILILLIGANLE